MASCAQDTRFCACSAMCTRCRMHTWTEGEYQLRLYMTAALQVRYVKHTAVHESGLTTTEQVRHIYIVHLYTISMPGCRWYEGASAACSTALPRQRSVGTTDDRGHVGHLDAHCRAVGSDEGCALFNSRFVTCIDESLSSLAFLACRW